MEERSQVGQKRESTRGTLTISTNQSSGNEYTPALPARSWEMVACQSTSVFPYRETQDRAEQEAGWNEGYEGLQASESTFLLKSSVRFLVAIFDSLHS